jgi:hypothetical protein
MHDRTMFVRELDVTAILSRKKTSNSAIAKKSAMAYMSPALTNSNRDLYDVMAGESWNCWAQPDTTSDG